jgi:oligopeptide/dipeptide ABC transporter ATP-binding protein
VTALLSVEQLTVRFGAGAVVDDVSFAIAPGEKFALVGESGSGKSITALSVLGLVDGATTSGRVVFEGTDLRAQGERQMRAIRGGEIAMIFQEPMTALNPLHTVGAQIGEVLALHEGLGRGAVRARAIELLAKTGIPEPARRVDAYPHQLSGGQRQRAMIAMALAGRPKLLIADEPTTALDVTIQAQILRLIQRMRETHGAAVVLITHDLGVVARLADRVAVMYAGRIVEQGSVRDLFHRPQHPYTWGLLASIPRIDRERISRLHSIAGQPPSLIGLDEGCSFRPRCAFAHAHCEETPPLEQRSGGPGHLDACWLDAATKLRRGTHSAAS